MAKTQKFQHGPLVEQCGDCSNATDGICCVCPFPAAKWRNGPCNYNPNTRRTLREAQAKKEKETAKPINPLKASKRAGQRTTGTTRPQSAIPPASPAPVPPKPKPKPEGRDRSKGKGGGRGKK